MMTQTICSKRGRIATVNDYPILSAAPLVVLTLGVVALAGVCLWGVFAG